MKSYVFKEINAVTLPDVAVVRHEPMQPGVWDDLARRELGERDRLALGLLVDKLLNYKTVRANEATLWARAIYPLLVLAERDDIRAFSLVTLAATFDDVEIHGEVDGALASSIDEDLSLPFLVVVEAKRGISGTDPMGQLLGAMLCAARLNEQGGKEAHEIYGCYTVADLWTFLRGRFDWSQPKPVMTVLSSREYMERVEAPAILAILESIVAKVGTPPPLT
jgi:hypothetical protein